MAGKLVILSGPSGSGKDTVLNAWKSLRPDMARVLTFTTREPRSGEVDGVHYQFVTDDEFQEMVERGEFLEHKNVHGDRYGSPRSDVERLLAQGKTVVLQIDVQGAMDVVNVMPEAITVFLLPPSLEELERRLRARGTETEESLKTRLENAKREMAFASQYKVQIVNDVVEEAVRELDEAVFGEVAA